MANNGKFNVILKAIDSSQKTTIVKLVKEQLHRSLREANAIVEAAPIKLAKNVSEEEAKSLKALLENAGAVVELVPYEANVNSPAADPNGTSSNDSRITYDLILKSFGTKKTTIVNLVKKHCGYNLEQATKIVESAPWLIKANMSLEEAENMKKEFEAAGAEMEIEYTEICAPVFIEEVHVFVYDVILKTYGKGTKTKVVEAVRESTGLTKVASQAMVEKLPQTILKGLTEDKANEIKSHLEKAGGIVELKARTGEEEPEIIEDEQGPKYDVAIVKQSSNKSGDETIIRSLMKLNNRDYSDFTIFTACAPFLVFREMGKNHANAWKEAFDRIGVGIIIQEHDDKNNYVFGTSTSYYYTITSFDGHKGDSLLAYMKCGHTRKEAEDCLKSAPCTSAFVSEDKLAELNKEAAMLKAAGARVWMAKNTITYPTWFELSDEDLGPDVVTIEFNVFLYPDSLLRLNHNKEKLSDLLTSWGYGKEVIERIYNLNQYRIHFDGKKQGELNKANRLCELLQSMGTNFLIYKESCVQIEIDESAVNPNSIGIGNYYNNLGGEDLTDLLPIKGISVAMKKKLAKVCGIYDIPGLLSKGYSEAGRMKMSDQLGVNVEFVTLWLKQADLWRVSDINSNLAYLLVLAGVRNVEDLAKLDVNKVMPVIRSLVLTHPDLKLPETEEVGACIDYAKVFAKHLSNNIYRLEINEEAPERLFADFLDEDQLKTDSEIISEGLKFLQDIEIALPLPHTISGTVRMRKNGKLLTDTVELDGLKVEIEGIASPNEEKKEDEANLFAYAEASGHFILVLPDKYNVQSTITFTVSQNGSKQKFVKQASEILDNVYILKHTEEGEEKNYARDLISLFDKLDAVNKDITKYSQQKETIKLIKEGGTIYDDKLRIKANEFVSSIDLAQLEKDLKNKKSEREKILKDIYGFDPVTNDLEKTLTNLLARKDLDSDLGDLELNYDVFHGNFNDKPKTLPSVKLMGEGETAVKLPTDTAPSRVFNYNMIQRLVEPAVYPPVGAGERVKLNRPIDVTEFKKQLAENPSNIPQMASLGIGYVLNMHQAWVPDGFALGTLLYSTILAPGEEQRLVVREQTQSYEIMDTAEGSEGVAEDYTTSQEDDTTATYNYAVQQLMTGQSSSQFKVKSTSVGFSAAGAYEGCSLGLNVGHSKTSGSASSSSRQSNSHNEASTAAQNFQHGIKTASERISQARRVSMRVATSSEKDSVATRIIANHNHSHAMTIQYWEVVRRYKLETSIDSIDLMLFVPLKPIQFLPLGETLFLNDPDHFNQQKFNNRYANMLRFYDALSSRLPYKYRPGLNLVQKYASYPKWEFEHRGDNIVKGVYRLTLKGNFMDFDAVKATLCLYNGKTVQGQLIQNHNGTHLDTIIEADQTRTKKEVEASIATWRQYVSRSTMEIEFTLPKDVDKQDVTSIRIEHFGDTTKHNLYKNYILMEEKDEKGDYSGKEGMIQYDTRWTHPERLAVQNYRRSMWYYYEDSLYTSVDSNDMRHYASGLPENYRVNEVEGGFSATPGMLKAGGGVTLSDYEVRENGKSMGDCYISSYQLQNNTVIIDISSHTPVMRYNELQKMEATLQHVANETMRYSQMIWASLSDSERAMMLERYTVDMNFESYFGKDNELYNDLKNGSINIPLLNCINVKKPLGFYGNCILFPFTYPQSLADKLGKTAAELQDALYRFHTSSFRVPSTVISLPTHGMIGEAVLGETNVSEEIDLTRFWNWKDSPIDSMEITKDYLNGTDYLKDKTTKDISALNLQSASATQAVTVPDLISALVAKQTPQFSNITGLDQINSLLGNATSTNAAAQAKVVDNSTALATAALGYATEKLKGENSAQSEDRKAISNENLEHEKQLTMREAIAKGLNPYQPGSDKPDKDDKDNKGNKDNKDKKPQPKTETPDSPKPQDGDGNSTPPSGETPTPPSGETPTPPSGETPTPPGSNTPTPPSGETPVPQSEDISDLDNYFDDISINEIRDGFDSLDQNQERIVKACYAYVIARELTNTKSILKKRSEYKRYKKVFKDQEDIALLYAGAYCHKQNLTVSELNENVVKLQRIVESM